MQRVAGDIFRLGSRSHNFYLLVEDGQSTIIDAGCSGEWSQLISALDTLELKPGDVHAVIATHVHADHIGLAPRLEKEGVPVSVHAADEPRALGKYEGRFSARATDLPLWSLRAWKNMLPIMRAGVMRHDHLEQVATFSDGSELDVPGRPVAIHTPGHTEGHTMFLCAAAGVLFTGDGLVTMDLLGSRVGPQRMPAVFDLDSDAAGRSLQRIVDIEADLLLPGHGDPWEGTPRRAVELAAS